MNAIGADAVLPVRTDNPPLRIDEGDVVRVGKSRVTLDLIVEQYENGSTAEELAAAYDTLDLADVHAVIAYYLRHRDEVRAYLQRREELSRSLQLTAGASQPRLTREDLSARRTGAG